MMGVLLLLELGVLDESEVSLVMVDFISQSCALIKGVKVFWSLAWSVLNEVSERQSIPYLLMQSLVCWSRTLSCCKAWFFKGEQIN